MRIYNASRANFYVKLHVGNRDKKCHISNTEDGLYRDWLQPAVGSLALSSVTPGTLTLIKNDMLAQKISPSTIKYTMTLFSQVWNAAQKEGVVTGDSASRGVSIPKADNARIRFLTPEDGVHIFIVGSDRNQLHGVQGGVSSNLVIPTIKIKGLQRLL